MIDIQRIFWNDDGTEKDLSVELNEWRSGSYTLPFVAADDRLYVACDLPFNHKYIEIDTANDQATSVSVETWYGNQWNAVVDLIDRTALSSASLAQSGIIEWKTDRLKGWDRELDSDDVSGVSKVGIYDMYWIRMSFSADLNVNTALKYIGNKFSSDSVLYDYYPDLSNTSLKEAFEAGKTTWDDQHFIASEMVIRDLKKRNIIISQNQILDYEKFKEPTIHKVAEIVYWALGRQFDDNRTKARAYYDEAINLKFFGVDLNRDGNQSDREKSTQTGYLRR